MKHRIPMLCLLLAAALLLACVPTPEQEIVVNKANQNEMLAAAKSDEAQPTADLRTLYHIPARMTGTYTSADGVVTVTADAEIVAPDGPLPILHVYAAEFEQPTVTALWNALVGDAVLYDTWENEETKQDIEKEMKSYIRTLDEIRAGTLDEDDSMYTADELEELIDELQKRYAAAPEGKEKTVEDGTLHLQYLTLGDNKKAASRTGIFARTDGEPWAQFHVENDSDNEEMLIYRYSDGWNGIEARRAARCYYNRSSPKMDCYMAFWLNKGVHLYEVKRDDPIPDAAERNLAETPAEAFARVDRLLADTGLSDTFAVSRAVVAGDSQDANAPSEEYAYCFELIRRVGTAPCCRAPLGTRPSAVNADEFAPTWSYEECMLALDGEGVFFMDWTAPVTVGDTVNANAKLKDFSEIEAIAGRMLLIAEVVNYDPAHSDAVSRTVERVELGLWRVAEQNELGKGLFVPAYCFYGTDAFTQTYHDYTGYERSTRLLLVLNAIDGSVIDPAVGY